MKRILYLYQLFLLHTHYHNLHYDTQGMLFNEPKQQTISCNYAANQNMKENPVATGFATENGSLFSRETAVTEIVTVLQC